jgi:hypothetical protein
VCLGLQHTEENDLKLRSSSLLTLARKARDSRTILAAIAAAHVTRYTLCKFFTLKEEEKQLLSFKLVSFLSSSFARAIPRWV